MKFATLMGIIALVSFSSACKPSSPASTSDVLAEETQEEAFNLATFLRQTQGLSEKIKKMIAPGDAFLYVGDKQRFDIETNATLKTQGESGLFAGRRGIYANQWIDAHVFGQRLGQKSGGQIVELGANADMDQKSIQVYFRFLGKDIYAGKVESRFEQSIVRDLTQDAVLYPVPLLGLKVGGTVGGELGLVSELGLPTQKSLGLSFLPKSSLHASLGAGLQILAFSSAEVRGKVQMLDFQSLHQANLSPVPSQNAYYSTQAWKADQLKALDGQIDLVAKAGLSALPSSVDGSLWQAIKDRLGFEWSHTVWDPEPLLIKELPPFASKLLRLLKKPKEASACQAQISGLTSEMKAHQQALETKRKGQEGLARETLELEIQQVKELQTKAAGSCSL